MWPMMAAFGWSGLSPERTEEVGEIAGGESWIELVLDREEMEDGGPAVRRALWLRMGAIVDEDLV